MNAAAEKPARRRSNSAAPQDLVKILRVHLPGGLDKRYLEADPQVIVCNYEDLILDILVQTARPTKNLLSAAALKAWQACKSSEAEAFGSRIASAVSWCYTKRSQVTTGVKLNPAVRRVLAQINKLCFNYTPKQKLQHPKRQLQKTVSQASKASKGSKSSKPEKPRASGSKETGSMSTAELRAFYDLGPATAATTRKQEEQEFEIISSGSEDAVMDAPSSHKEKKKTEAKKKDEQKSPKKLEKKKPVEYFDNTLLCLVRMHLGKKVAATVKEGPGGFLLAEFEGEEAVQTEIPNLVLHGGGLLGSGKKPMKRPAAASAAAATKKKAKMKDAEPKPVAAAAAASEPEDSTPEAKLAELDMTKPLPAGMKVSSMYYKGNSIGFKVTYKNKSKQPFSFGGKYCGKDEAQLRAIGAEAAQKLRDRVLSVEAVKAWCHEQLIKGLVFLGMKLLFGQMLDLFLPATD